MWLATLGNLPNPGDYCDHDNNIMIDIMIIIVLMDVYALQNRQIETFLKLHPFWRSKASRIGKTVVNVKKDEEIHFRAAAAPERSRIVIGEQG